MSDNILKELFTYHNLVHAISGATGGATAITTFYPLNIIRTKLQVDETLKSKNVFVLIKEIAEKEGFSALYQGWWSSVVSLGCSNFVYFYTYNAFKALYFKYVLKANPKTAMIDPITNLAIASSAGIINVLCTTPLWVAGTRLMVQSKKKNQGETDGKKPYTGVFDTLTRIVKEEGVPALWNGVGPSLMLVSNPSIQFSTYERLRGPMARIADKRGYGITSVEFFVMGAIAKAVATVFTYPIQIAQSRLRADKEEKYKGSVDCLKQMYAVGGVLAWFKGMEAKLWQTVLTAAFQFLTYEQVQKVVFWLLLGSNKVTQ
eukprot:snap_masked-scaffold_1-processed-gene-13.0-mRNA-1 protein AED:0.22 eAED:0.22 QI:0/-1/0/1/-1/1/1/0/316